MASNVMTGARAKVFVDDVLVGIFDSCSYSVNIGAEPIHTLGKFGPQEITPTSYEAVTVNCSGFRVIGNGAHKLPKMPKLEDLLNLESVKIDVVDRRSESGDLPIMSVQNCIPVSYSTSYQAKASSRIQITYMGEKASDESGSQAEQDTPSLI